MRFLLDNGPNSLTGVKHSSIELQKFEAFCWVGGIKRASALAKHY
jgi:hypothetical protein